MSKKPPALTAVLRPRRLAWPRTSPFHGGNTGSNPVGDAKHSKELSRFHSGRLGFKKVQFCWNAIIHNRCPCYRLEGSTPSRIEIRSFRALVDWRGCLVLDVGEQERHDRALCGAFCWRHCLGISIESDVSRSVAEQFLHHFDIGSADSQKRRVAMAKGMPANAFCDAKLPCSRKDLATHDMRSPVGFCPSLNGLAKTQSSAAL